MKMKVLRLRDDAVLPSYSHPGDAGLDLSSVEDITLESGVVRSIHTGIAVELPANTEGQIRPRSGLALDHKVTVLNAPGTIDAGYRGEIEVILINHGLTSFRIHKGMKIAQMVVKPVINVDVEEVKGLSDTSRGSGGFGSTDHGRESEA